MRHLILLLATTCLAPLPATAQDADPADPAVAESEEDAIIIEAERPRGSVFLDVEPEEVLDARDIQATGATSIAELLEAIEPQTQSNRGRGGGRPILLVNGRRISGFRELRDLPPEAIERVDILAEDVALAYGYAADQRVVNFVLRDRFLATTVQLEGEAATDGGREQGEFDVDWLVLRDNTRTTISFDVEPGGELREDERDIILQPIETVEGTIDPRPFRTLIGRSELYRLNGTHQRPVGDLSATVNLQLQQTENESLFGPAIGTLEVPGDNPFAPVPGIDGIVRRDLGLEPLGRDTTARSAGLSAILNSGPGDWRWSITADGNVSDTVTYTDRGPDLVLGQAALDALDPDFDPFGALTAEPLTPRNRAESETRTFGLDGVLSGKVGPANVTLRTGASSVRLITNDFRDGELSDGALFRRTLSTQLNLEMPVLENSAIGDVALNANGALNDLSDFGGVTTLGAGLRWQPSRRLNLGANWTLEEGAPSLQQLGNPRIADPATRFFDFVNGESVLLTSITGGNPGLQSDNREVLKLSANWRVPVKGENDDLSVNAEYVNTRTDDPVASFPAASEAIEATFPTRFVRDGDGSLVLVDLSPVNYLESRRDTLRWGLNWSKRIPTEPPSAEQIAQFRERFRRQREGRQRQRQQEQTRAGEQQQGEQPEGQQPPRGKGQARQGPPSAEQRRRFQRAAQRRGFGGGRGGRLYASVFHEVTLIDDVTIAEGLPRLNYLDGEPLGRTGGRSRHTLQFRGGYFNNGLGLRLSGDWRSATAVDSGSGEIRFDDYATFDLRAFVNLNERFDVMADAPWLRGTSLRFGIDNIFNARPQARDENGVIPIVYQPDLLEPEGRTISISIRKIFSPRGPGRGGAGPFG
ncbi:TonB-dependent receptor plug domain-containing protein [Sphingomicrobium marinum]|uniref:TonB-dependent receptor plug domain-containing protein n=1 Tax=Sphingomicrobium marinum TaxID=1227950 RepID=UPI002240C68E|nr:TonB-dependent receptor plug domain-containing protein [Sphingomicrobium marinum]